MDCSPPGPFVYGISQARILVGSLFVGSVSEIQKDLNSIRLELVKIQSSLMTEERVEKIVDSRIEKTVLRYHPEKHE